MCLGGLRDFRQHGAQFGQIQRPVLRVIDDAEAPAEVQMARGEVAGPTQIDNQIHGRTETCAQCRRIAILRSGVEVKSLQIDPLGQGLI